MADIFHSFPIQSSPEKVFAAITEPASLNQWWTLNSSGSPQESSTYELDFGAGCQWKARVSRVVTHLEFELELTESMDDWLGTRVGFRLQPAGEGTQVDFWHVGWAEPSQHYKISTYCWAMYLRILKRYLELGEQVAYADRLNV